MDGSRELFLSVVDGHSTKALTKWSWPGKKSGWTLIGHEHWDVLNGVSWKARAQYAHPNPSTTPRGHDLTPLGHWIVNYNQRGWETHRTWSQDILTAGALFLPGGGSKGEGKGQNKGKGYAKGKGKGSYTKGKGKGKGYFPEGKGRGEGYDFSEAEGTGFPKGKNKGKSQSKDGLQD